MILEWIAVAEMLVFRRKQPRIGLQRRERCPPVHIQVIPLADWMIKWRQSEIARSGRISFPICPTSNLQVIFNQGTIAVVQGTIAFRGGSRWARWFSRGSNRYSVLAWWFCDNFDWFSMVFCTLRLFALSSDSHSHDDKVRGGRWWFHRGSGGCRFRTKLTYWLKSTESCFSSPISVNKWLNSLNQIGP